ncbi:ester cyclase [Aureibaculum sp. A20]|uniref:Ester cyclase n=1 Tax=Aureibaculum flavum TaxID=2795986 RepID=A0ABS0WUB5_9FLAO|nr:ester cyclase [Aureibaculum flavum]MBJ2175574.1 ester cyclase [Aureibaculum flavum]
MKFRIVIYMFIGSILLSCNPTQQSSGALSNTTIRATISNYLISQNSIGRNKADTLLTENFIRNMNGIEMVSNINEHKANMHIFHTGFPDMNFTFPSQFIKDNEAFIVWIFTGTHTGIFGEINATGMKIKVNGISHLYLDKEGKIYREDVFYNELDLLQQLGFTLNPPITE